MDAITAILEEIHPGKTSFLPVSAAEPDMIAFQALAKTLVFANEQGYLDGFLPHRESSTEHGWYDCVVIEKGLSYQGKAFLMSLLKANPTESTPMASHPDSRAPARAGSPVAEHLRILELASRNDLPDIVDRVSAVSYQVTCELIDAGHLSGLFANSTHGMSVINPLITLSGPCYWKNRPSSARVARHGHTDQDHTGYQLHHLITLTMRPQCRPFGPSHAGSR
jgi:hypothetical protein